MHDDITDAELLTKFERIARLVLDRGRAAHSADYLCCAEDNLRLIAEVRRLRAQLDNIRAALKVLEDEELRRLIAEVRRLRVAQHVG